MCAPLTLGREVGAVVRHHHERWDGTGYVDALAGDAIPLPARIVAIADAYDAMVSGRPYQRALPADVALARLERGAGSQWDPEIVPVLAELVTSRRRRRAPAERAQGEGGQ
jgi:putative two-component system response regulator